MTADRPANITTDQMRQMHALLRDHGITGDNAVHDYLNLWLDEHDDDQHPLESRKDLASVTAAKIIRDLQRADLSRVPGGLARALVALQAELPWVNKTKTARVPTKSGGEYSYTYADLADVTAAAFPLLVKHGLAFTCCPRVTEKGGYELVGVLLHVSGEEREGALPLHGNDPQALGGAITYMRRYLLGSMLGIVTDDDADGRQAMGAQQTRQWDGPTTRELLLSIERNAARAGVTYEQATAKFLTGLSGQRGIVLTTDDLDELEPWLLSDLAYRVEARADEVVAEQRAAALAAQEAEADVDGTEKEDAFPDPTDTTDPWATPSAGATGEQPPA